MKSEQKQGIEKAIWGFKRAVTEMAKTTSAGADMAIQNDLYEKVAIAQNALYDAIGHMEEFKFNIGTL